MLEDDNFLDASVYISPPGDGIDSDEDSDTEEGCSANHLSASQLTAPAAFVINYGADTVNSLEHDNTDSDDEQPEAMDTGDKQNDISPTGNHMLAHCPPAVQYQWVNKDLKETEFSNKPTARHFTEPQTPTALFSAFFNDDVIEYMVRMSNLYAQRDKSKHSFSTDVAEMRLFLAMLLLSGYSVLPRRKMYWENSDDVFNRAMSHAMSRNRFEEILSVFHLADNHHLPPSDAFAKVRPLYAMINEKCLEYFLHDEHLSIDESMLPYYGRHSSKQRIVGKPIRMGYKMWVLASSDGYVVQFEPYQGAKKQGAIRSSATSWGLGESVVLDLLGELSVQTSYHIFTDNFFTSFRLLSHLLEHNIQATGVIKSNKLGKCPVEAPKSLEKKERGYFDQKTDKRSSVTVVGWNDNRSVYVASNTAGAQPTATVSRWCRKTSSRIDVRQPRLIKLYNRHMGGVDRCDQNISSYRISVRSKKWWWALFVWIPDMVLQNCWLLYR